MLKKFGEIVCCMCLVIALVGCTNKSDEIKVDDKQAEIEFDEYITSLKLPSYLGVSSDTAERESLKFDVTGDGQDDLIRFLQYGSGMPRISVSVYDPVNHVGYLLDSFNYSYSLESCTEKELVICKYEYGDKENSSLGTIVIDDGRLLWSEK